MAMPVFKDLDEMIKNIIKKFEEDIRETEREIERTFSPSVVNYERPLYSIVDHGDCYEVIIDLPFADPKSLNVSVVENVLSLVAEAQGKYYRVRLTLPSEVDSKSTEVTRTKNFVRIKIKKKNV